MVRHNAVRDVVYNGSRDAGLAAEREKPGLLPPRSAEEGLPAATSSRLPADVWQPRGPSGGAETWDFSIRSGMTNHFWKRSASCPEEVLALMEQSKRSYQDTASVCRAAGFLFEPLILEAHGGRWSSGFRTDVDRIAAAASASNLESKLAMSLNTALRISCSLQRENARAVLRRTAAQHETAATCVQVAEQLDANVRRWQ